MKTLASSQLASIILGINDGLIELTGALVGFTFALKDHNLVALSGLITGIAAALSMAASAFMQARHEQGKNAPKAALMTGTSYLIVVILLVMPYFVFTEPLTALPVMLVIAFMIVALVAYFNSAYLGQSYAREFGIMLTASLGVAAISFVIGNFLSRVITRQ